MHSFSKLTIAALASYVAAAPLESTLKHSTHKRHVGANGVEFTSYHPAVTYEVNPTSVCSSQHSS